MNIWALSKVRWQSLAARERRALAWAALVLVCALVWAILLAPALRTLRQSEASASQLRSVLDHMQQMQLRARALQTHAAEPAAAVLSQIRASFGVFGATAVLQVQGDRVTVQLRQASADRLAVWLADSASHPVQAVEVHLKAEASGGGPLWSGSLVFRLPQQAPQVQQSPKAP